jgi:PAS domain S-box-containing protein
LTSGANKQQSVVDTALGAARLWVMQELPEGTNMHNDLSRVVDALPGLVWTARPDGHVDFLNQRWCEFTGLGADDARGRGWQAAIHPEDLPLLLERWPSDLAGGERGEMEARLRRFDGQYRWFLFRTSPIADASGQVIRWCGINTDIEDRRRATETDIDDRKRAEDAIRESEARKTAILDSALDCIVTIDHVACITEFNPAAERTFGYRRDEVVGKQLADVIIPPALREQHQRGFARYLATGEARVLGKHLELTAVRADGSEFPVELTITRIPLDGPPSFTGYLRDITERKRSGEELRRSEAFLAEAQRLSLTGSFSWSIGTDNITWSDQLYRIYGFDQGVKLTHKLIVTRIHPDDAPPAIERMDSAVNDGRGWEDEYRLQMPDQTVKHVHFVAHAIPDKEGRLEYIGAVQDVTERWLSEEALAKARLELAHVARITTLGTLTASIAHEVNQPLSGIITNASTCLRMLAAEPPNVDGALETARRTIRDGNRAAEVIRRLRALFARKVAAAEPVDLNDATREVIALSTRELKRNRVILKEELADDLPPVTGDRVQLQQVILNLLRNAAEAMSAVNDRPRQLVIRTEREEGDGERLTVRDAGVGFGTQGVDKLFQPFYTTKSDGMGIGLSVSRSIIENHNGRLWAEPNDGPGATFSFSIPRKADAGTSPRTHGRHGTPVADVPAEARRNS